MKNMEQIEFEKELRALNEEYSPRKEKLAEELDALRKQNRELVYRIAQLDTKRKEICMTIQDLEAQIRFVNAEYRAKYNDIKVSTPNKAFTLDDMLCFAQFIGDRKVTKEDYKEFLNRK